MLIIDNKDIDFLISLIVQHFNPAEFKIDKETMKINFHFFIIFSMGTIIFYKHFLNSVELNKRCINSLHESIKYFMNLIKTVNNF